MGLILIGSTPPVGSRGLPPTNRGEFANTLSVADDGQAGNFVDLLREIRAVSILSCLVENASAKRGLFSQDLDAYSNQAAGGYWFLLTVACPAGKLRSRPDSHQCT